jgi:hypothetical protein
MSRAAPELTMQPRHGAAERSADASAGQLIGEKGFDLAALFDHRDPSIRSSTTNRSRIAERKEGVRHDGRDLLELGPSSRFARPELFGPSDGYVHGKFSPAKDRVLR